MTSTFLDGTSAISLSSDLTTNLSSQSLAPLQTSDLQPTLGRSSTGRNVLIFVADGLRSSSVNAVDTPTLYSIRQEGVDFANSHSIFPTLTEPNGTVIASGHYIGDTGAFGNNLYPGFLVPTVSSPTPAVEDVLLDLNEKFDGNFLNEESLLAFARQNGYSTAAIGKSGPTLIQDITQGNRGADGKVPVPETIILDDSTGRTGGVPLSPDFIQRLTIAGLPTTTPNRSNGFPSGDPLNNGTSGNNTTPGTLAANTVQQQYFADATTNAILPYFKAQGNPFAMVYWSRDPDGTQHNQGDSLNSLTPGVNGDTSKAAVQNADRNLAQIIQQLKIEGLYDNTDIFVTADHGVSTISKQLTDTQGGIVKDYASTQTYPGVNPGFLPLGFVAIDIAHDLDLPLYDPNTPVKNSSGQNIAFATVDPTQGQRPTSGNGLIGGTGAYQDTPDAKVIVAANSGSDLIYVPDKDLETVKQVVDFLSRQDYTSGIFVDDALGAIPGALPLSSINFKGSAQLPTPTIVVNFRTFATDLNNPTGSQVLIADYRAQQGQGAHGSFGRGDTFNNMAAIGPDFKRGYQDLAPVSNADVAITLANVLGFNLPSNGNLTGRVISEALVGGPNSIFYTTGTLNSTPANNGQRTYLNYQQVGDTKYFDAAGFAGRTVGLQIANGQTLPGDGNLTAINLSKNSPIVQSAFQSLIGLAQQISDPKLRAETLDAINNPATVVRHRVGVTDSVKDSIIQQLIDAGLVDPSDNATFPGGLKAGIFPPVVQDGTDDPQLPQTFFSAPGSSFGSHHSSPGGLAVHEVANDFSDLNFANLYQRVYGNSDASGLPFVAPDGAASSSDLAIDLNLLIAAPMWHDWAKTLVFQWKADGTEFSELSFGGNGKTDNYGQTGDSKTGAHHILGLAESIKRGLSPEFVITQASAHSAPTLGNEYKVVNWIRAAAIIAQVDPVAAGYLSKDSQGQLRLPPVRQLGDLDLNASGQTNLLVEYTLHNLSDADFVFTIPAVSIDQVVLRAIAPEFGYDPANTSTYNNGFRNPVLTYLSAERLQIIYSNSGLEGVRSEIQKLRDRQIV